MILSAQSIRKRRPVDPFHERTALNGMTFGLSAAGYDVRIRESVILRPGDFALASTLERFTMPDDLLARVADKSSWARKGLTAQNTVVEPGWEGYLTLELANHGPNTIRIEAGSPIAQILFELLDEPTEQPYAGKYQNQPPEPVAAIEENAE
jgi:dCTP deaminase